VSIAILDFVFTVGVFGALGSGFSFSTGFIEEFGMEGAAFLAEIFA